MSNARNFCVLTSFKIQDSFYNTIRYDTVYLTFSKKLTDSQLRLPHGTNKNVKEKLKINCMMSMISPVHQSHYHQKIPVHGMQNRYQSRSFTVHRLVVNLYCYCRPFTFVRRLTNTLYNLYW